MTEWEYIKTVDRFCVSRKGVVQVDIYKCKKCGTLEWVEDQKKPPRKCKVCESKAISI